METETPFKEGYLLFPPHGVLGHLKKSWHRRYCQLFKSSKHGIERLEVFDSEDDLWKNSTVRIMTLENCVKITQDVQKHPNVFTIVTKTGVYHFATMTEKELTEWVTAFQYIAFKDNVSKQTIEEDNDLYCSSTDGVFTVRLVRSDASQRCGLEPGYYVLVIASAAIQLRDNKEHRMLFTWPYRYIRRYGYREGKFTFEAGRKCETGEGVFHLEHSNQQEIFRCLSTKMKNMRKLLNGEASTPPAIICGDNQFQAALSMEARTRSPLPPSPTSATTVLDLDLSAMSQSSNKSLSLLTADTKSSNSSITKPKPILPIQQPLPVNKSNKTEEIDHSGFGRYKPYSSTDILAPLLAVTTVHTPVSSSVSSVISTINKDTGYDKVEVRREAWRTLGVDEVSHTERPFDSSDVEEDGLESILMQNASQHSSSIEMMPQSSKILVSQIPSKSNVSEYYDTLQHFGSTSKLNSNPGYRHISSMPSYANTNNDNSSNIQPRNVYGDVLESMQACRMADDSHYGYGIIRKKSIPNDTDANEKVSPNHKVYNELEYAVVQKPKKV